ncbi:MAG: glycoside hydrolase family 97 protein [Bacteroidales bacterium]|nr:glycoside hydrolase family 97 protein [Bacteroidales bacterium]
MRKSLLLVLLFLAVTLNAKTFELKSPNGELKLVIDIADKIGYSVYYNNDLLLKNCFLKMYLPQQVLGESPQLVKQKTETVNETIIPVVPLKFSSVENSFQSLTLSFKGNYSVEFRVFNDGIAYRFLTSIDGSIEVLNEDFSISFAGNYQACLQQPASFKTSCEELYTHVETSDWDSNDRFSTLPVLIDTRGRYKVLISESGLSDYPCMFLKGTGSNGMQSVFPKVPLEFGDDGDRSVRILKEADCIAKTSGNRAFPWRYFVITKDDRQLIEQTMTCRLAPPCEISDPSWIRPGQVSWEWWNDASPYGPDVNFVAGYNLETYKYYIDFAANFGIPYIIMDEGWAKTTRDPYTPNPTIDLFELIRYGKEKNVDIILWLTWLTVENNFDLFKTFSEWGIAGVKIDFMDRSDQWMVNFYERVAKEAAKYQLFVDFHGSFKPAGLEYKYPNVLSYEGVRGMEQMGGAFPDNSLYLPFMRNAVGPMDYTPGAMISMHPEVYCGHRPNSASIGTRAYQMALFVVFESGLQMLADNPSLYYREKECTEFITRVPTTWDETKALYAQPGELVVVAKRKGSKWYIGAIANGKEKERRIELDLSFLEGNKTYLVTSFEDGINAGRQAMDYRKKEYSAAKGDKIKINLVRNGGWVAVLE